jgi:hypothetical protein
MRTETLNSWRIGRPFGVDDASLVSAPEDSQETMETVEVWLEASAPELAEHLMARGVGRLSSEVRVTERGGFPAGAAC